MTDALSYPKLTPFPSQPRIDYIARSPCSKSLLFSAWRRSDAVQCIHTKAVPPYFLQPQLHLRELFGFPPVHERFAFQRGYSKTARDDEARRLKGNRTFFLWEVSHSLLLWKGLLGYQRSFVSTGAAQGRDTLTPPQRHHKLGLQHQGISLSDGMAPQ